MWHTKKKTITVKLKFTHKDFNETRDLAGILKKIDNTDATYAEKILDEMFKRQPFFLTVLIGYRLDVTPEELDEIMKVYFIIWEYFRTNRNVQTKEVSQDHFEKAEHRNIQMLKYIEGEPTADAKSDIYGNDLQNLKSKSLMTAVFFRFNERPTLLKMEEMKKVAILIGVKSFIECFENI